VKSQRWVLALTSVGALMVALDALVVSTALSTIRVDLGASLGALEWTVNAYGLSFAVLLMTAAALGDRVGRRRIFTAGVAVFMAASAACALAPDIGWLIAARAVQGAGAAMVMPLAMALLTAAFPPEQRGRALGLFGGVVGLAVLGGPTVGGAVTEGLAWQWIFWLNVPIGAAMIPLILTRIDESFGPRERLDLGGVGLVSGGVLGLVWGLVRADDVGWTSAEVIATILAGAALLVAFVLWELRTSTPMLPMRLFTIRAFAAGNATGLLMYAALTTAVFFIPQYLQTVLGYGPLETGLRILPWGATLFVVGPLAGSLVNRIGERRLIAAGLTMQAAGMAWVALVAAAGKGYPDLIAPLILAGVGISTAIPAAQSSVLGAVRREAIGKASGAYNMLRQVGAVFGVAALAAVFSATGGYGSPEAFRDGFAPAIGGCAVLSLAGAIAGLGTSAARTVVEVPRAAEPVRA
jgi:EmrB/QacA subfamily drug resistance transporter